MRRVLWVGVFIALVARAIQRVGWVKPPDPEERDPQWNPLPSHNI